VKPPPLPLEEAQARLLALAGGLPVERVDTASALGRYLAAPVIARRTQPSQDLSAMDGYAVLEDDLAGPWRIAGESAAGHPFGGVVARGEAIRISTGAVLPQGAGAVILQEDLRKTAETIELTGEPPHPPGKHVRRTGLDFRVGEDVLAAGTRIGPAQIALAISAGHRLLAVRRLPRVMIIDSGDELAEDCEDCPPHQIPASNGAMLAAMLAALPCHVERLGPVADNLDALGAALEAAREADIVVTTGGASVGDHDLIRPALEAAGASLDFWRVAIKPGKPLLVAARPLAARRQIVLGLPGNPVSCHVTAFLFLLPLVRSLLGAAWPLPRTVRSVLAAPLGPGGSRREFLRASWDGISVAPRSLQDSGALSSLAASNALIDRAAGAPAMAEGGAVSIFLLGDGNC
jgi:molybdopterin molybdotransferase